LTVSEAFSGINPQIDDQVKSHSEYSTYTGQGWIGSLTQMTSGNGYKYFSNNSTTQILTYSPSPVAQQAPVMRGSVEPVVAQWTAATHRYPNTMTLTAVVVQENGELQNGRIEIGAFSGNECRGSALLRNFPQIAEHSYMGFLVIYGENDEEIRLRVYNHATGEEYPVGATQLSFAADDILGTPDEPFRIAASPTGIRTVANEAAISLKQEGNSLQINHPWESVDCIELLDLNGRTVLLKTAWTAKSIDVSSLANGMYILKLTKDNQTYVKKFIHKGN
jgi:hypothetical protein